jgi:hypothetical protein
MASDSLKSFFTDNGFKEIRSIILTFKDSLLPNAARDYVAEGIYINHAWIVATKIGEDRLKLEPAENERVFFKQEPKLIGLSADPEMPIFGKDPETGFGIGGFSPRTGMFRARPVEIEYV